MRRLRLAEAIFLAMQFAVAPDIQFQIVGKGIDHRDADAVQTARDLVGAVIELTAGMQHGHDDLGGGTSFLGVDIHRYSTAVVGHRDRFIRVDGHDDAIAMTGQRLVNGVIHNLENHVMQAAAVVCIADVHAGTFSDGVQAF